MLVCPACQIEMRPKKCGRFVEAMTDRGSYELWCADLYECPSCPAEVLTNFADQPISRYHHPDYKASIQRHPPDLRFWKTRKEKERYAAGVNTIQQAG